jgi:septal ring factor EnvC (AmiA/AmiB activator)
VSAAVIQDGDALSGDERLPKPRLAAMLMTMKNRIGIILLTLVCVGLVIGLIFVKRQATEQKNTDAERIGDYSNKWVITSGKLDEREQVIAMQERDLDAQKRSLGELTNTFTQVSANLARTEASLKASQEEMAKRDAKITELEAQNHVLDQRAIDLSGAITNLTTQIDDTRRRLAASEGDKALLEGELKRLMAEKTELERQFNDLTVLRAQVAHLKEELSIARRLDWIRQGLFASADQKGAQKLMQGFGSVARPQPRAATNYDLNVEVSADGSVRVIPPLTNAPPATNALAK